MATYKLLLLPGDGIGPEVMAQAKNVVAWLEKNGVAKFAIEEDLVGGSAYEAHGKSISEAAVGSSRVDLQACKLEYSIVSPK